MSPKKTLIILPTYNEAENIERAITAILTSTDASILVVDDQSPDGTARIVETLMNDHPRLSLLNNGPKAGLGFAYREGFKWALRHNFDFVIEMDSDGSHSVEEITGIISSLNSYDLVIGSRYIKGGSISDWNIGRRFLSRFANIYTRFILGLQVRDSTSGFRGIRSDRLPEFLEAELPIAGYAFQIGMTHFATKRGWSIKEIPIHFTDRVLGKSKMSTAISAEAFIWTLRLALSRKLR